MNSGSPAPPALIGLLTTAIPIAFVGLYLGLRKVGLVRSLCVAVFRMVGQLLLLGFVLRFVFEQSSPGLLALVALVMLSASAQAVGARHQRPNWTLRFEAFLAMAVAAGVTLLLATQSALGVQPWYKTSIVVPILGMILGNSVNGLALAADRFESRIREDAALIERRLALGATSDQAVQPAFRTAIQTGLTPTINGMMVAGIVAIPGMTTGQLLAGAEPTVALSYQIMIYLAIGGSVGIAILTLLKLRVRHAFTNAHQLRRDFLENSPPPVD